MNNIELLRCEIQTTLDSQKTQAERNKLGQFATPTQLANDVLTHGLALLPKDAPIRFVDPAIGTGSFYSALIATGSDRIIQSAIGFEIDPHYGKPSIDFWQETELKICLGDFTLKSPPTEDNLRANLLICNPPYVRHHHLESKEKARLHVAAKKIADVKLSGLAGLYCYFMALAHDWMSEGGIAGWLIPSEFMDVNYGRALKDYLLREVTLLSIHRFDPNDVQFDDALVSSAVVWFKKEKPSTDHSVIFSYGGSMESPKVVKSVSVADLHITKKWTRFPKQIVEIEHKGYCLSDLFSIKRGLATGDNKFFILDEKEVRNLKLPSKFLRPILPSSRYIKGDEIHSDSDGVPLLNNRLFLVDCDLPEQQLACDEPELWEYLQTGSEIVSKGYLCRSRKLWYSQERRPPAPIVCTYFGRSDHDGKPFRFLLNNTKATATNGYLMLYPKPAMAEKIATDNTLLKKIWEALNNIGRESLLGNGRVYGGGLHKLEPKELANVPADLIAALIGLSVKNAC